jgi:hypothetical protein
MNIEIISTDVECSLDTTRNFGILLSKALTTIRMVHWYAPDFNTHEILGQLYSSLEGLFDKLQEEIIGTSRSQGVPFPAFSVQSLDIDDLEQYNNEQGSIIDTYFKTGLLIKAILKSRELENYFSAVISGLQNTKDEIISAINKAEYLLSLVP